jgi:hypothetical protein
MKEWRKVMMKIEGVDELSSETLTRIASETSHSTPFKPNERMTVNRNQLNEIKCANGK